MIKSSRIANKIENKLYVMKPKKDLNCVKTEQYINIIKYTRNNMRCKKCKKEKELNYCEGR